MNRWNDPPCGAGEAVSRAVQFVRRGSGEYRLGTGDFAEPNLQTDCAGFALCYAWKLKRHRPGFNAGPWASVEDDINTNSAIEDADHRQQLFTRVDPADVREGDVLAWPSFRYGPLLLRKLIGHCAIVMDVPKSYIPGKWSSLTVAQSYGPNGRAPAAMMTSGVTWDRHDAKWPMARHQTSVLRPVPR